ncbi:MAG: DNA methyltransferase [bacterium]|nr:DNA methyltransferase [candidate division KSB1 bacterium]MDH7559000.1 DNA methyltransferase [bacterium]
MALAEGSAKQPVYKMHKWWARRLGSVFRMIILATFGEEAETEQHPCQKFITGADLHGPVVLDPFMGGGTTVVEALRLSCKVIGMDINPVAWFVTKKEIEPVDIGELDRAFKQLESTVGSWIKQYYRTTCPRGHEAEVMYFFWVKVIQCRTCGEVVHLFPDYQLSRRNHSMVVVCPSCLQVLETEATSGTVTCSDCGRVFDPHAGGASRGNVRCPRCHAEDSLLEIVAHRGSAIPSQLHALEGYCPSCGRFFKKVDDEDLALWRRAQAEYERVREELLLPDQVIPAEGRSDPRPVNHGYMRFRDMFNERQLLCLSRLLEAILQIPDANVREAMLLAFSDCLDANNMFCTYEVQWHKISLFFGLHAYHRIERLTENNVWGTQFGRGTFVRCFHKVRRAKQFCASPLPVGRVRATEQRQTSAGERIEGRLVDSCYTQLRETERAALLRCASSEDRSFLPDQSVDAVITDPPYFDNIQYSELADFFYVWLRLGLRKDYPWFEPELSSRGEEIVQNDKKGMSIEAFCAGLTRVFSECHRVLKAEGLLVFTFHHNKVWAWESLGRILLDTGFYVVASPMVRSEGKSGFHSSKGNIRYDCVLVCRKRPSNWQESAWSNIREHILGDAIQCVKATVGSRMSMSDADIFATIMAKTVDYYAKAYPNVRHRNEPFTLAEALGEMKDSAMHVVRNAVQETALPRACARKAEQLSLFVREARATYGKAQP